MKSKLPKHTAHWSQTALLPPERVLGKPEPFLGDERVIGLGMPLRCPHCGGDLEPVGGCQGGRPPSRLGCKNGHLLVVSLINGPGGVVLYLTTRREPESLIHST
jgi:hypothetical protein